jgi:hypothetical protein
MLLILQAFYLRMVCLAGYGAHCFIRCLPGIVSAFQLNFLTILAVVTPAVASVIVEVCGLFFSSGTSKLGPPDPQAFGRTFGMVFLHQSRKLKTREMLLQPIKQAHCLYLLGFQQPKQLGQKGGSALE